MPPASTVAAVPLTLIDVPRRTATADAHALAAGLAVPARAGAVVAHVRRARALADRTAAVGFALLAAGGAPGLLAAVVHRRRAPLDPAAAAVLLAVALGLPLAGDGRIRRPGAAPEAVGWLAAALGPRTLAAVAAARPHLVGPVDGMPVAARDLANRRIAELAADELDRLGFDARAAALRRLAASPHALLLVDPGRGLAAQVIGDLDAADHVAVVVPGMGNAIERFDVVVDKAEALRRAAADLDGGEDLAVVAWLGYDSPGVPEVLLDDDARAGADDLVRLVAGLPVAVGVTRSVIGHSYGSVVAAEALQRGLRADAVAVTGSPGMPLGTREAARDTATPVYALRTDDDAVSLSEWFGDDPADTDFGATRLETGAADGHAEYFDDGTESLRNLALVATGRAAEATVVERNFAGRVVDRLDRGYELRVELPVDTVQDVAADAAGVLADVADAAEGHLPGPAAAVVDGAQDVAGAAFELGNRTVDLAERLGSPDFVGDLVGGLID